jgi:hypothetical protein
VDRALALQPIREGLAGRRTIDVLRLGRAAARPLHLPVLKLQRNLRMTAAIR